MFSRNIPLAAVAVVALLSSLPSQAAIIDFNATTAGQYLFADYDKDGFRISAQTGHYDFFGPGIWCNLTSGICPDNFLNVDDSAYGPATTRLAQIDGSQFDLNSFDVLDVYQFNQQTYQYSACGTGCTVRSSKGGNQQITAGAMNFSGTQWTGLDWIEFVVANTAGNPHIASSAIDNINVTASAVPAPASLWLFATGLAALMGRAVRRQQRL